MADELWDELQNLALGRDDPKVFIPEGVYAAAVASNRLSVIARPLNPRAQNLFSMVSSLPRTWGLDSRVHGRVLDGNYVQFLFQSESDLISVERRAPWVFNNWFVAAQRWEDIPDVDFLTSTELWVHFRGIPLPYVCEGTVRLVAERIGEVLLVDYQEFTTPQIAYIRVRIRIGLNARLRFFQRVMFDSGESALVRIQYERLRRICSNYLRITHHRTYCPYRIPLPDQRDGDDGDPRIERERCALRDDLHRSDLNSQSQNSEASFPAPISPPPRVAAPPPNADELVAAMPWLHRSRSDHILDYETPNPQSVSRIHQLSTGSNSSPTRESELTSKLEVESTSDDFGEASKIYELGETSRRFEQGESSHRFEGGESSKRKHGAVNESVRRDPKQKGKEHMIGGILKPPKKR
ncbi:uncharacterized protein At4g02000-like [Arabidopsis lyrata subsp. lyrata]|uniref:uncharacterized protein At4g02000-like n=1 Tax=Arabidopsis lyrata subsp. lyrata TaxID=81972 RepID=UPI000A29C5EB|nr:uncharacterized protein At4g02000-like [Arabidopsis lyrata subsp. lyrata]|eukprot:XP_020874309.1 uncharacterized protein At4g02000-like [Arabidopsis lyrata subsp. lyrata]